VDALNFNSHFRLFAGLWILLIGGFMQIFIQNTIFELALSLGGAVVFSFFIIFDTQVRLTHKFKIIQAQALKFNLICADTFICFFH